MRTRTWRLGVLAAVTMAVLCAPDDAAAQLNQYCTVSVLNRTVRVNADGTWVLPNVPANTGRVKARATCVQNGVTRFGESEFFTVPRNGIVTLPRITLGPVTPIPDTLVLTPSPVTFSGIGQTSQLIATATYPDRSTKNVAAAAHGTDYTTSNPNIVTVSADGLLTAVASGTVVIQAINEGTPGMVLVTVVLSTNDTDGDGIPDDIEASRGMDPRNPVDAIEDFDRDNLTNLDEYRNGTDLRDPDSDDDGLNDGREVHTTLTNALVADTDGDLVPDGVEVTTLTNPRDRDSYDLRKAVAVSTLLPTSFLLTTNPVFVGDTFQQLSWVVRLIDGKTVLDLTADPRTGYFSSDLNVCSFGAAPGRVFAGQPGACTIVIRNSTLSVSVPGTINRFTPTSISSIIIPGYANSVDVSGDFAFVAAGAQGLQIVNVADRAHPAIVASRALAGNANDVVVVNQRAYVAAGSAGLQIVDVSNPLTPSVIGSVATGNVAWDVVVKGNRAYVASGTAGLKVIDVSNPSVPVSIGSLALSGTTKGVDVDEARNIAVVARGTTGIAVVDVQNSAAPAVIGILAGGDVRDVAITGSHVLLADFDRSLTAVDLTNPSAPALTSSTPRLTGGLLQDVAVFGSLAAGADVFFVNGVPLFEISDAANPVPKAIIDFSRFRDDEGTGIALDSAFVYLTAALQTENGTTSTRSTLYIGQYRSDDQLAPAVTIQSPPANHAALEGSTLAVTVDATDNFAVAAVSVLVDGVSQATATTQPYQLTIPVPVGVTSIVLSAQAVDFAGNRGTSSDVPIVVVPDTERPAVQLTAPTAPLVVPEGTVIHATAAASDNVRVTRVEFLLNDVIVATRTAEPYEAFITLPIGPTSFRFSARAFDPAGNSRTASEVVVTVTSDPLPIVRIVTPEAGATFVEGSLITVVFDATDNGAVMSTEVDGLINGEIVYRNVTNSRIVQLSAPIDVTQLTLIATATDNLGQVGTSQPVVVNIEPEPAPSISFVQPREDDTLVGGSTIRVVLDATDDVSVDWVLLEGASALFEPPYEIDVAVAAGIAPTPQLNFRAWAVDNIGKGRFVDLSLPVTPDPLTSLQGLVTDVNGLPVEGATVNAISNGLTAELFRVPSALSDLPDPSGTPDAVRVISTPSMIWPAMDPFGFSAVVPQASDAHAILRLRGTLHVPTAGSYKFNLFAYPAGRLTVNGVRIVDLSTIDTTVMSPPQFGSSTIELPAGDVPIEIIGAQDVGFSHIRVEWGAGGGRMQAIPLDALTPAVSPYSALTNADGSFTIADVPSVTGDYTVRATFTGVEGTELSGVSAPAPTVPAGTTDVGTIQLAPTLHPVSIPIHYMGVQGLPRVDVAGESAYVAAGSAGLMRVLVYDAEHPRTTASLELPGDANDVRVLGSFAYVAGGTAGLHVVTNTGPFSMERLATLPLGGDAQRISVVHDDRLLIANGNGGLSIIDVSNPAAPVLLGVAQPIANARGVDFFGGRYAAVAGTDGLTIVDVANPAVPVIISTLAMDAANSVALKDRTALVATANALVGVDLTNPQSPSVIFEEFGPTGDVRMAGSLAVIAQLTATSARAAFVDLHDRANPTIVNSVDFDAIFLETDLASVVTGVTTDGTFVYVTGAVDRTAGDGFLAIGQYNRPVDASGVPPIIYGSNIYDGAAPLDQSREGEIEVLIGVQDDVAIDSINIFVNGQLVVTRKTASSHEWAGTLQAPIPIGAASVQVRLEVTDVGGNVSSREGTLAVKPYLPFAFSTIGPYSSLPGDITANSSSIWLTLPDAPDTFNVERWSPPVTFHFRTPAAGMHRPTYVAADDIGNGWVANTANNTIVKINFLGGALLNVPIPSPGRMLFDGTQLWVVSGSLQLKKIRSNDGAVLGTFFTGGINPGLMTFDGSNLWVVNHGSNNIARIRTSDGAVLATTPVSANVTGIAFDGTHLWLVNGADNTISIVRASDATTVATLATGNAPGGIAFDGAFMWVTNSGDNTATKFRVSDRATIGTIVTGPQPTRIIAVDGYLWVLNSGAKYFGVYRLRDE